MKESTLLLLDSIINLVLGILLLIFPRQLVDFLGIPLASPAFYPNILGGVLIGIGIALWLERGAGHRAGIGLGLGGAIAINLCGGLVLAAWLLVGDLSLKTSGLVFLWLLVALLLGISLLEIGHQIRQRPPGAS